MDLPLPRGGADAEVAVGVCLADVSTGRVIVGGMHDGALRTELRRVVNGTWAHDAYDVIADLLAAARHENHP